MVTGRRLLDRGDGQTSTVTMSRQPCSTAKAVKTAWRETCKEGSDARPRTTAPFPFIGSYCFPSSRTLHANASPSGFSWTVLLSRTCIVLMVRADLILIHHLSDTSMRPLAVATIPPRPHRVCRESSAFVEIITNVTLGLQPRPV